ncbi:MAG: SUMF1/EgtB/PvdO family nonheme iron enzyme [Bacteroidales bacterium]|nr:SUMF1/EgtB/PvdO family nonheme iron enzyme [Bacteroidales bacterium]
MDGTGICRASVSADRLYPLCRYAAFPSGSISTHGSKPQGSNRVLRGGNWNNNARNCRSAYRNNNNPDNRNNNVGFRVVFRP